MQTMLLVCALMFAVAPTNLSKLSEQTGAKLSWNVQNHRLQLRDTELPVALQQLCVTELARLRRPLADALAADLPPDSVERRLLTVALQNRPDVLVRLAEILPPPEEVCLQAGATLQGDGGETICSVCGQDLSEFDQDMQEAAAADEWAELAFAMEREERGDGDFV